VLGLVRLPGNALKQHALTIQIDEGLPSASVTAKSKGSNSVVVPSGTPAPLVRPITRSCSASGVESHGSMSMRYVG
jgi:hypothetical protein